MQVEVSVLSLILKILEVADSDKKIRALVGTSCNLFHLLTIVTKFINYKNDEKSKALRKINIVWKKYRQGWAKF